MEKPKFNMGIYQIRNLINGKIYIGASNNLDRRWREHRSELIGQRHGNEHLQKAWNKYGEEYFVFEILEYVDVRKSLPNIEQKYLNKYTPEYNIKKTANVFIHHKTTSEATRKKLSKLQKGENNSFYGKKHSEDTKQKISAWSSSRTITEKHKQAMRVTRLGTNNEMSKLDWDKVRKIRSLYSSGKYTQKDLGKLFNVCSGTIGCVLRNETWKE